MCTYYHTSNGEVVVECVGLLSFLKELVPCDRFR
jgi:hypothetical protein